MFHPAWFGKYLLLDKIARGGMAEIFLAKLCGASGFEKELVIKRILPEWSTSESFLSMLIDEAKLAVLLTHANIVQIYELGREGQGGEREDHYIAMEFVDGVDLRQLWEKTAAVGRHLPLGLSLHIMTEVLNGLSYAHRKKNAQGEDLKIIHRDISPQNILISFDGAVKLTDFGIAKATLKSTETASGVHKGKFAYMSPEQANLQEIAQSSDIFSAGIVFYEVLTGRRLFGGGSDIETLDRIRRTEINFSPEEEERIPLHLREILLKALSRTAEERFRDAASFGQELGRLAAENGLKARREDLADFMESVFKETIHDRKRRREERREMERSLTIALPADATRILVTQPGHDQTEATGRKGSQRGIRRIVWGAGAVGLLFILLFLGRDFGSRQGETKKGTRTIPPVTEIRPPEPEGPRELGATIPKTTASERRIFDTPPPPPPPSVPPPPTTRPPEQTDRKAPPKISPETLGTGLLSVMATPWAYISIDGGERRESPVVKVSLKAGPHLVRVFYEPDQITLNKTLEIKEGTHARCLANFEAEKKEIRCRE